jgi:hypothetical protein
MDSRVDKAVGCVATAVAIAHGVPRRPTKAEAEALGSGPETPVVSSAAGKMLEGRCQLGGAPLSTA